MDLADHHLDVSCSVCSGDLPEWVTSCVRIFWPTDAETWVFQPVPALDNRSLLDVMNQSPNYMSIRIQDRIEATFRSSICAVNDLSDRRSASLWSLGVS